jgi:uracil-DNA glycosylase
MPDRQGPNTLSTIEPLLRRVRACTVCADALPLGPRPVVQAHEDAPVLIVGQAPGRAVHASGVPFDDPSGDRLRNWLGVTVEEFYDPRRFAIVPVGFCYPGRAASGDAPPRRECAELWLDELLAHLPRRCLTLLLGAHAQRLYLGRDDRGSVGANVAAWRDFVGPDREQPMLPLPHPSPRNVRWFLDHPRFEDELLPELRVRLNEAFRDGFHGQSTRAG